MHQLLIGEDSGNILCPVRICRALTSEEVEDDGKMVPIKVDYLAEGAANVLFRLEPTEETEEDKGEHYSLLLRLRKGKKTVLASEQNPSPPPFEAFDINHGFLMTEVVPALGAQHVMPCQVVEITPDIIDLLNNIILQVENSGKRPAKRVGWLLLEDQAEAFLLPNMQPHAGEDALLLDFKPKWLALSPSAPFDAVRCRTCALDIRNDKSIEKRFCPIALASGLEREVQRVVEILLPALTSERSHWKLEAVRQEITLFFTSRNPGMVILDKLKAEQIKYDPEGVLALVPGVTPERPLTIDGVYASLCNETNSIHNLAKAMTFRDCSIMMKISRKVDENGKEKYNIEAKLADFDVKVMSFEKLKKWVEDELSLFDYYRAREQPRNPVEREFCFVLHSNNSKELHFSEAGTFTQHTTRHGDGLSSNSNSPHKDDYLQETSQP